jgi:hypothetical protein
MKKVFLIIWLLLFITPAFSKEITITIPDDIYQSVLDDYAAVHSFTEDKDNTAEDFFVQNIAQEIKDGYISYEQNKARKTAEEQIEDQLKSVDIQASAVSVEIGGDGGGVIVGGINWDDVDLINDN